MFIPPQRKRLEGSAKHLPDHLDGGRGGPGVITQLLSYQGEHRGLAGSRDLAVDRLSAGVTGGLAKQHPRGIRMGLDVCEPGVEALCRPLVRPTFLTTDRNG
jgi:hypothetical protein